MGMVLRASTLYPEHTIACELALDELVRYGQSGASATVATRAAGLTSLHNVKNNLAFLLQQKPQELYDLKPALRSARTNADVVRGIDAMIKQFDAFLRSPSVDQVPAINANLTRLESAYRHTGHAATFKDAESVESPAAAWRRYAAQ